MRNNINRYLFACILSCLFACERDAVFEKEQYKNVFALVSEGDNVLPKLHDMEKNESTGYISASMGGTNPTTRDVRIQLKEDPSLIEEYNVAMFDVDASSYHPHLPSDKYDVETLSLVIPAGEITGSIPIRIRPHGLSPDSSYFIAFKVVSFDTYEVNPEKNYVLYRIRTQNRWAVGDGSTNYTMRGRLQTDSSSEIQLPGTKIMAPISANQVRIIAGNELYESKIVTLRKGAIILEINPDYTVKIKPYANLDVSQIDGDSDFPNIFFVEDDGFKTCKTFLLHYRYNFDGTEKIMKEELRLEFNKNTDDYEW
ncbi:MAG: DUF1735 domain-containing protein [Tannerella sp.]|jgi:hypothetical protein|nr:DUF1735 domain-containing protein [Tannerella sp.]